MLDYWWFDHNHDDLWSQAAARDDVAERVLTVIDANVFFDLTNASRLSLSPKFGPVAK